ncbi:MAG: type II toxin-antitoxin system YoeB family toxin [Dysgonamonadaceae bacterium]|nr:type II toxin-antitoxin system YoeB family toxin [Dysgonamonadaceae bacterium]
MESTKVDIYSQFFIQKNGICKKRIKALMEDIEEHLYTGIGKPEALKWISRKILCFGRGFFVFLSPAKEG